MKTPRLVKSWLDPQLDWLDMPECLACVVPIDSPGLIELIATGFLDVPLLPEAERPMLVSMVERDRPLVAALVQGIDQLSPTAQAPAENTVKVYYRGIFHLTDRKEVLALVVLVPHDDAQYSFIPQALKSQAQALFGTYRAESAKWEAAEDDRKRKNEEFAASIPVDQRGLFVAAHTYGEQFRGLDRPSEPRLTPLLDLVPKATWVESLPRVQSARLHKVAQAIDQSSLRLSRDGRYAAVVARPAEGGFGAVLTWAERDLLPSYPEIRMAVTRVVPRALARPRRSDVVPPRFEPVQTRVDDPVELGNMDPNALEDAVETLREFSLELPDFQERVERGKRWISQAGFEAIGWYQPFHEWNEASWGTPRVRIVVAPI